METRSFIKIDSILIYEIKNDKLIPIEEDNYIANELKNGYFNLEIVFALEDEEEAVIYYANKEFLDMVRDHEIDDLSVMDYAYYIKMLEEDGEEVTGGQYKVDFDLFISSLKQFRNEAIIKNSFKIKQKRISKTKLEELQEKIKMWED